MTGIDCVSFLALIQLMVAFDFGLFYLDEKHQLVKLYTSYKQGLQSQTGKFLQSVDDLLNQSKCSKEDECIVESAYLSENSNRLRYFLREGVVYDGWAFLGFYGGIYGLICMFFLCLFKCDSEYFAQTYILICAQLIAVIDLLILWRMSRMSRQPMNRSILHNTVIILGVLIVAWLLSFFGLTIEWFSSFEKPFVFTLGIIALPILVFVYYIIKCQINIWMLKRKCKKNIKVIRRYIADAG